MQEYQSVTLWKKVWIFIRQNIFIFSSLSAIFIGIVFGLILKASVVLNEEAKMLLVFPGEMLIRMLHLVLIPLLIIPLLITSVAKGGVRLDEGVSGKIARRAAVYFLFTTLVSVIIGILVSLVIKPGAGFNAADAAVGQSFSAPDALMDLIRNIVPENLICACVEQYKMERTVVVLEETDEYNNNTLMNVTYIHRSVGLVEGVNTAGLIFCSFVFSLALNQKGQSGAILIDFLNYLDAFTKYMVHIVQIYLPAGVMFLIVSHVIDIPDWEASYKLGKFIATVVVGLVIHGGLVLPLLYVGIMRRSPVPVFRGVSKALVTALLTSSSSATLPVTIRCCEEENHIHPNIVRFMLPIGTNVNMDGSALYETVAVIFIAQRNNVNLDALQLFTVGVMVAVSSISAAGVPVTGAVTTLFVLRALGLPTDDIVLLALVEWLLDRCNTMINVLGDCIGVAIVEHLSKNELDAVS